MEIGKNIRKIAKKRGIKLQDLARAMEIKPEHLARVIDSPEIKVKTVNQVAEILKCLPAELLGIPTVKINTALSSFLVTLEKE